VEEGEEAADVVPSLNQAVEQDSEQVRELGLTVGTVIVFTVHCAM